VTDNLLNGRCRRNRPLSSPSPTCLPALALPDTSTFTASASLRPQYFPGFARNPSNGNEIYAMQLFERLASSVGRPRRARGRSFNVTQKLRFASLLYKQLFETTFNFQIENLSSLSRRHSQTQILAADLQSKIFITSYYVICYEHSSSAFR